MVSPRSVIDATLLPLPDSPTTPSTIALRQRERDAVDRAHDAVVGREPDTQVSYLEKCGHLLTDPGSRSGSAQGPPGLGDRMTVPLEQDLHQRDQLNEETGLS